MPHQLQQRIDDTDAALGTGWDHLDITTSDGQRL
jgi:hypothetical protein